ncbi:PH domain-containing protein [Chiayiivirga flava]|uniref:YdbS-like PH domain-containing protein n=1 Tax=Chiayiivirga flava TaxID=659595 RepID=A0A7W8FZR3_9GAMM|nr:PH domain-containing protein [Chiayiivirga flava]MBB5207474.1 hypothetical protein [Chiayiivirga flava]
MSETTPDPNVAPDAARTHGDVPAPDAIVWEPLHPYARYGMALGALTGFGLPYVPLAAVTLAAWDSGGVGVLGKMALFLLGLVGVAALSWRYAVARFRRTRFALAADGLRIRRGVFWRSETLIPRSRVQHTDLNRGPLDRQFGLATLKVYTAGTKLASVGLDGLPDARAVELRDALVSDDDDAV